MTEDDENILAAAAEQKVGATNLKDYRILRAQ
jgi:hypothetical protein